MQKTKSIKFATMLLLLVSIFCLVVSYVFDAEFVEKYIDEDQHIGEHAKLEVDIFQIQMFHLGIFFGLLGLLGIIFSEKVVALLTKRRELLTNIAILIFVLVIFLVAGELLLRVLFSEQIYSEYGFGPGAIKFANSIQYNSLGFRDVEHSTQKDSEIFRIVVIGDSFSFGAGIENPENVYARILQKKLDEKYGKGNFEVINLSGRGYSTVDAVETLKDTAIGLDPDLVVLSYYINDAEGVNSRVGFEEMYYHDFVVPYALGRWLYMHSFIYYFLESRTKNILKNAGLVGKHLKNTSNTFTQTPTLSSASTKSILMDLYASARKGGLGL